MRSPPRHAACRTSRSHPHPLTRTARYALRHTTDTRMTSTTNIPRREFVFESGWSTSRHGTAGALQTTEGSGQLTVGGKGSDGWLDDKFGIMEADNVITVNGASNDGERGQLSFTAGEAEFVDSLHYAIRRIRLDDVNTDGRSRCRPSQRFTDAYAMSLSPQTAYRRITHDPQSRLCGSFSAFDRPIPSIEFSWYNTKGEQRIFSVIPLSGFENADARSRLIAPLQKAFREDRLDVDVTTSAVSARDAVQALLTDSTSVRHKERLWLNAGKDSRGHDCAHLVPMTFREKHAPRGRGRWVSDVEGAPNSDQSRSMHGGWVHRV